MFLFSKQQRGFRDIHLLGADIRLLEIIIGLNAWLFVGKGVGTMQALWEVGVYTEWREQQCGGVLLARRFLDCL